ncbi:MAG: noncanonical pyrimidine nucleotidase, YjjG family [Gammaproteobacteria bacterium]|nr:noncanonical pyrimidine nucleotidase, YjjG family [Gammaproteobacteria bacterium]
MNNRYELIFFDADETLYDYKKCEETAFHLTLQEFNILGGKKRHLIYEGYMKINAELWNQYHQGRIKKEHVLKERWNILFQQFALKLDGHSFGEQYLYHLSNQSFLIKNAEEVTQQLSRYCKLAIITNGVSNVHRKRLETLSLQPFISNIVISGDHAHDSNFRKPYYKIFEFAHFQTAANVPIYKILMVGDTLNSDIAGGINYKVDTCWFNPTKQVNQSDVIPTYEIEDLKDLINIVIGETT